MNWITKLERKFGRYCIPNLISILIGGQILVYAVELFVNQYISFYLNLDRGALLAGQIWRVITFMFVPFSGGGPLSVVLGIYFTWFIGTALEKEWGDFRFNLYLLLGMLGAVLACLCTGWAVPLHCQPDQNDDGPALFGERQGPERGDHHSHQPDAGVQGHPERQRQHHEPPHRGDGAPH